MRALALVILLAGACSRAVLDGHGGGSSPRSATSAKPAVVPPERMARPELVVQQGACTSVIDVALSRDGKSLAAVHDDVVVVWDVTSGRVLGRLPPVAGVRRARLSSDGATAFTLAKDEIAVWDLRSTPVAKLATLAVNLQRDTLELSPDDRTVAFVDDAGHVELWTPMIKVATSVPILTVDRPGKAPPSLVFSANGKLLAADWNIVDVATSKRIAEVPRADGRPIAFGVNDNRVFLAKGPEVIEWSLARRAAVARDSASRIDRKKQAWEPDLEVRRVYVRADGAAFAVAARLEESFVFRIGTGAPTRMPTNGIADSFAGAPDAGVFASGTRTEVHVAGLPPDARTRVLPGSACATAMDANNDMVAFELARGGAGPVESLVAVLDLTGAVPNAMRRFDPSEPGAFLALLGFVLDGRAVALDRRPGKGVEIAPIRASSNGPVIPMSTYEQIWFGGDVALTVLDPRFDPHGEGTDACTASLWDLVRGQKIPFGLAGNRCGLTLSGDGTRVERGAPPIVWDVRANGPLSAPPSPSATENAARRIRDPSPVDRLACDTSPKTTRRLERSGWVRGRRGRITASDRVFVQRASDCRSIELVYVDGSPPPGEWLVLSDDGRFDGSRNAFAALAVRTGPIIGGRLEPATPESVQRTPGLYGAFVGGVP